MKSIYQRLREETKPNNKPLTLSRLRKFYNRLEEASAFDFPKKIDLIMFRTFKFLEKLRKIPKEK